MIYFNSDYTQGACPEIMQKMIETNLSQTTGYGEDKHCYNARMLIKKACNREDVDVHFLVGGTQTNMTFIASALRPHQAVMCAKTGHINVHESGAIEATGHKVMTFDSGSDGKVTAEMVEKCHLEHINDVTFEHTVQPKMVYISNSTENGTVYTKKELKSISDICRKYGLILYLDGARLGYAMASPLSDISLEDLCELCDAFYIGGTKVGALMGEALVIVNDNLKSDFRYIIKQKGGMFAKGRLLGIQFECLFTDNLYSRISQKAVKLALETSEKLEKMGISFLAKTESNLMFPILSDEVFKKLSEKYVLSFWEKYDETQTVARICTSWATEQKDLDVLLEDIEKLL